MCKIGLVHLELNRGQNYECITNLLETYFFHDFFFQRNAKGYSFAKLYYDVKAYERAKKWVDSFFLK